MNLIAHFEAYSAGFLTGDDEADRSILLKIDHTMRVLGEAREIAANDGFTNDESRLLDAAALLHDYGRFEQYTQFRTFRDRDSVDHGELAARLVREHRLLREDFSASERGIILCAIRVHNQIAIPGGMTGMARKIAGAVRDADKLDIMPRLLEHFANPENGDVVWGMPQADHLTPEVEEQLLSGLPPDYSLLKTATDFGASKFNWVYDLNCRHSKRKYLQCGFLKQLRTYLPPDSAIDEVHRRAEAFLEAAL